MRGGPGNPFAIGGSFSIFSQPDASCDSHKTRRMAPTVVATQAAGPRVPLMSATEQGAQPLRPKARLVRAIGNQLISSEVVAMLELVKNAYDADASCVLVLFASEEEFAGRKNANHRRWRGDDLGDSPRCVDGAGHRLEARPPPQRTAQQTSWVEEKEVGRSPQHV